MNAEKLYVTLQYQVLVGEYLMARGFFLSGLLVFQVINLTPF